MIKINHHLIILNAHYYSALLYIQNSLINIINLKET